MNTLPRRSILALSLLSLAAGCVGAPDDPSASQDETSQEVITSNNVTVGTAYRYSSNGASFDWTIYRSPRRAQVSFRNARSDGSWSTTGTINRWARCPSANEAVQVINASGQSQSCTHVCLPDGREELHCPSGQLVFTRINNMAATVSTGLAVRTPRLVRGTCDRRIGCLGYSDCSTCCGETALRDDGIIDPIEATGCEIVCTFSGGDLGTSACDDPYPPTLGGGGSTDNPASTCMPMSGYPTWCNYAF